MQKMQMLLYQDSVLPYPPGLKKEVIRKAIHMLAAFVPPLAAWNSLAAQILLALGLVFYAVMERLRTSGVRVQVITSLTEAASRERDADRFSAGPLTLGFGMMLALFLLPLPVAAFGIYALAFGDGLSSLAGKLAGTVVLPGTGGKTAEGSSACFLAVFLAAGWNGFPLWPSVVLGLTAMVLEALPLRDWDNVVLPVGVGFAAGLFL